MPPLGAGGGVGARGGGVGDRGGGVGDRGGGVGELGGDGAGPVHEQRLAGQFGSGWWLQLALHHESVAIPGLREWQLRSAEAPASAQTRMSAARMATEIVFSLRFAEEDMMAI